MLLRRPKTLTRSAAYDALGRGDLQLVDVRGVTAWTAAALPLKTTRKADR